MAESDQRLLTASPSELYERYLVGPVFRPFAEELLRCANPGRRERLLDVACGTGVVARLARAIVGDAGRIVGVDASPGMLSVARTVEPAIDWRQGDAARLPVGPDEQFDVVACHQGLQFLPDKAAAIREMRRVLAPTGRLVIGTWRTVEETPLIRDLKRVAERHLGSFTDLRHSLGDADTLRRLLTDAGFQFVQVQTVSRVIRMSDGPVVFPRLNTMASIGMSPRAKEMTEDQRAHIAELITRESVAAIDPYVDGSNLVFELTSNLAVAQP